MFKKSSLTIALCGLSLLFSVVRAQADIEWSGVYRFEILNLKNTELNGQGRELNYGLTHLVLRPKIVAGDGLTIFSQFDLFNNRSFPSSQLGQYIGGGMRDTGDPAANSGPGSNTLSTSQRPETLQVSQLYLTYNSEYGSLLLGRVPLQFGLGVTHNAGRGLFDHFYDTDDIVGYKIVMGNLYFLPMFGKNSERDINNSDHLYDYMIQVQYNNPENDVELGVFYQMRIGGDQASDAPLGTATAGDVLGGSKDAAAGCCGKVDVKTVSIYSLKDTDRYRLGLEAAFQSGQSGVITNNGNGDNVTMNGFGVAGEFEYRPLESRWKFGAKAGLATGDDPTSAAKYEGFTFNRNYDIAMLMFNHPLGEYDALRTKLVTGNVYENPTSDDPQRKHINVPDVDTVSNAIYLAPSAQYSLSERWGLNGALIAGWTNTNPLTGGMSPGGKSLGYEFDFALNFSPRKGIMWVNQMGLLFPGPVWKGGDTDSGKQYDSSFAYGLGTKAAISF